jgi:hypothetical protein
VQSASSIYPLPLSGERFVISFQIEGRRCVLRKMTFGDFFTTGVDYFRTMGIPDRQGPRLRR